MQKHSGEAKVSRIEKKLGKTRRSLTVAVTPRQTLDPVVQEMALRVYEGLDCAESLSAAVMLRHGDFVQLASMRADPSDYLTPGAFWKAAQACDFLRKFPGLPLGIDKEQATVESWFLSERECKVTNLRLRANQSDEVKFIIEAAQEFVAEVLGRNPLWALGKDALNECPDDLTPRFGPGATVSDRASRTTVLDKLSSRPTLTSECTWLLPLWHDTAWARALDSVSVSTNVDLRPKVVKGNIFFTVPKDATIFRGCAKGPSINVAYQAALGRVIRSGLRSSLGIDISTGQAVHQDLARRASREGRLATVDQSRASDTMCLELVKQFTAKVPLWTEVLSTLRESYTQVQGKWVRLEKFSAMGNGYTFELETLIFLAITAGVCAARGESIRDHIAAGNLSCYGDDLIIPVELLEDCLSAFRFFGFTPNVRKTYGSGEFRESCGGDFFAGECVNTYKLEEEISTVGHLFAIHNGVKARMSSRARVGHVLSFIRNQIPKPFRLYGPKWLGDIVIHGEYIHRVRRELYIPSDGSGRPDPNQVTGTLRVLKPKLRAARIQQYHPAVQLAYVVYTGRAEDPKRRPTADLEYAIVDFTCRYESFCRNDYRASTPKWVDAFTGVR